MIFEEQRFGNNSEAISSQETADLKQCLELCCNIINCHGVTFTGVIVPHEGQPNCHLVRCRDHCLMSERTENTDGLISVIINRTQSELPSPTNSSLIDVVVVTETLDRGTIAPSTDAGDHNPEATTFLAPIRPTDRIETGSLAPIWAVGVAIVIAVVCIGLNLGLLSAYICYRRKRSRKQTAQITINKGPTLHAYNPTL
nr:Hypothetical protein CBG11990 [Haemonchus contortus]